jgi:hypothetical protein
MSIITGLYDECLSSSSSDNGVDRYVIIRNLRDYIFNVCATLNEVLGKEITDGV